MRRQYDLHGVGLEVRAPAQAVLDALELRLSTFATDREPPATVRLEFTHEAGLLGTIGAGRPVYDTRDGSLYYDPASDVLSGTFGDVTLWCAAADGSVVLQSAKFSGRALYLAVHPLTTIALMELLERRGLFALHAACLADGHGNGVLLAGPSGSGKSTLAVALARAGMNFLSDDTLFLTLEPSADRIRAMAFPDAIGVTEYVARHVPELSSLMDAGPADGFTKRLHRIGDLFASSVVETCIPRLLVFPEVLHGLPSRAAPLDPGDALLRLVPDVLLTNADSTQRHLGAVAAVVDQVDCHRLGSGIDLARACELVQDMVARATVGLGVLAGDQ